MTDAKKLRAKILKSLLKEKCPKCNKTVKEILHEHSLRETLNI